ncbi:hypothetical protein [Mycolicibacterium llatzerense]|uniref:hypothetical protein n=1 Tax=Mycolicibacterium llatzerense TaxID=280871 RepID=UPI0021B54563|nr:hypothetical protein [Mycolicibacterium llatzerense]MCT7371945.1 hypothetical protein [Mycolicibacterium llatzerense]
MTAQTLASEPTTEQAPDTSATTTTAAAAAVAPPETEQSATTTRPQILRYTGKAFGRALETTAMLLIGVLTGIVLTLAVLLSNVVSSLPPTAIVPGFHGWSTIIVNPSDWRGSGGTDVLDRPSDPDVANPTQPSPHGPAAGTQRTR